MISQLYSLSLTLVVISLTILEKNRTNRIITPFTLAAWPFVIICLLNNFILVYAGFYFVTARAQLFIMINLIIIWLVGFIMSFYFINRKESKIIHDYTPLFKNFSNYQYLIISISWIVIFLNFHRAYSIILQFGGYWILGDIEFEKIMGTGPIAHMVQVGKVCFLLLIFTFKYAKNKYLYVLTIIGLFLAIALIQVKYHLMFLIIFAFLFYNLNKTIKVQLKGILRFSLYLLVIMNMFWFFLTLIWGTFSFENKDVWIFFLNQFMNYFVSGPIILEKWISFGDIKPDWTFFIVFINIKNFIIGNPKVLNHIPLVSQGFFHSSPDTVGNVGTSFGVFYFIGGYYFSFIMSTIIAVVSYILYYKSMYTKNIILIYFNFLFLTLSLLNFFVQYFTLLSIYEMSFIFVFVVMLVSLNKYIGKLIRTVD